MAQSSKGDWGERRWVRWEKLAMSKDDYDWAEEYEKAGYDPGAWYLLPKEQQMAWQKGGDKAVISDFLDGLPDVPHYKNHPSGVQPKDVSGHHTYNVGTAITYLMRSPFKHDDPLEDIVKARDHLNFEIDRLHAANTADSSYGT